MLEYDFYKKYTPTQKLCSGCNMHGSTRAFNSLGIKFQSKVVSYILHKGLSPTALSLLRANIKRVFCYYFLL